MATGELKELSAQHVDTGMGFERLCMVLQAKQSNYDTDVFTTTIKKVEELSGIKYTQTQEKKDIAFRVIADHIRAVSFAIADGQMPSNTGAGYVIRRILRRAIRYGYSFLNMNEAFICKLVEVISDQMGTQFPELRAQKSFVEKVIREEEESFLRTLESGIKRFETYVAELGTEKVIDAQFAFLLKDTFGFPEDLTDLMAREKGLSVDMEGFAAALEEQKNRSRKATEITTDDWVIVHEGDESTEFIGYDNLFAEVRILRYRQVKDKGRAYYQLVLDRTPFYAESGGQVGDKGYLQNQDSRLTVIDTKKENNLIIHLVEELPADAKADFTAMVDVDSRSAISANHSATHLLHFALRERLGTHVEQKGSLVNADYLRFDFSHFEKVTDEDLSVIEKRVNQLVRKNTPLQEFRRVPINQAREMGAMALFGEKYGEVVRVIQFGDSIELCGGTHVLSTGHIGLVKVTSEGAVAAGIRRIEALSGVGAELYVAEQEQLLSELKELLKAPKDLVGAVKTLQDNSTRLGKELEKLNKEKALLLKDELMKTVKTTPNGVQLVSQRVDLPAESIKDISFALKAQYQNLVLVLGAASEGKALISVMVSDDLVSAGKFNANTLIKELSKEIKGGGGGQPFYATAGGKEPEGLDRALEKINELV